ncbi:hypothetical protein IF1G_03860 [Cordyceps javanica]|uniref:Uncharacterized protein n=1 Tax=Cordyceps javanica TaxID=43265 RepID=A0A545V8R1_9HYPO|nr:hypothetical protein IF1G_03860 [Cordyceps javanica]
MRRGKQAMGAEPSKNKLLPADPLTMPAVGPAQSLLARGQEAEEGTIFGVDAAVWMVSLCLPDGSIAFKTMWM